MATLAEDLYRCYHNDEDAILGDLDDKETREDRVVHDFLRYAYYLCDLAEVDAEAKRGLVYYR